MQLVQKENAEYRQILNKSKELQKIRKDLEDKYKSIKKEDLDKLNKMIPDTVDNVRLILDIDNIAKKRGMRVQNPSVEMSGSTDKSKKGTLSDSKPYGSITMSFDVSASYEDFLAFMKDLEESLRLVDVTQLSIKSTKEDIYNYNVTIQTYWLR
jgi:Tfp pilus assembly protein PilO